MSLIYSKEFDVDVIPSINYVTFNCNPNKDVDIHNVEKGCCCWKPSHTYKIAIEAGDKPMEVSGYLRPGPSESHNNKNVIVSVLSNDEWIDVTEFSIPCDKETPFYVAIDEYENVTEVRFTSSSGALDKSYGKISFIKYNDIDNIPECESQGGYWYNDKCHCMEPKYKEMASEEDCERYGWYWANGACHLYPEKCEDWLTQEDCINAECEWHTDEGRCFRPNVKVYEYELPTTDEDHFGGIKVNLPNIGRILEVYTEITVDCPSRPDGFIGFFGLLVTAGDWQSLKPEITVKWKNGEDYINTGTSKGYHRTDSSMTREYVRYKIQSKYRTKYFKTKIYYQEVA